MNYSTDKYVILFMYFSKTDNFDKLIRTIIIKKIHLIKNLKANLLIENNILSSKNIDIFNSTKSVYINNCDFITAIPIKIKIKSQIKSIHTIKPFTIFNNNECFILIY